MKNLFTFSDFDTNNEFLWNIGTPDALNTHETQITEAMDGGTPSQDPSFDSFNKIIENSLSKLTIEEQQKFYDQILVDVRERRHGLSGEYDTDKNYINDPEIRAYKKYLENEIQKVLTTRTLENMQVNPESILEDVVAELTHIPSNLINWETYITKTFSNKNGIVVWDKTWLRSDEGLRSLAGIPGNQAEQITDYLNAHKDEIKEQVEETANMTDLEKFNKQTERLNTAFDSNKYEVNPSESIGNITRTIMSKDPENYCVGQLICSQRLDEIHEATQYEVLIGTSTDQYASLHTDSLNEAMNFLINGINEKGDKIRAQGRENREKRTQEEAAMRDVIKKYLVDHGTEEQITNISIASQDAEQTTTLDKEGLAPYLEGTGVTMSDISFYTANYPDIITEISDEIKREEQEVAQKQRAREVARTTANEAFLDKITPEMLTYLKLSFDDSVTSKDRVIAIQKKINTDADGWAGPNTIAALGVVNQEFLAQKQKQEALVIKTVNLESGIDEKYTELSDVNKLNQLKDGTSKSATIDNNPYLITRNMEEGTLEYFPITNDGKRQVFVLTMKENNEMHIAPLADFTLSKTGECPAVVNNLETGEINSAIDLSQTVIKGDIQINNPWLTREQDMVLPLSIPGNIEWNAANMYTNIQMPNSIGGNADLSGVTKLPEEGFTFPETIYGTLDLSGLKEIPQGVVFPKNVGNIDLSGIEDSGKLSYLDLSGTKMTGELNLSNITGDIPRGFIPPTLDYSLDASGMTSPKLNNMGKISTLKLNGACLQNSSLEDLANLATNIEFKKDTVNIDEDLYTLTDTENGFVTVEKKQEEPGNQIGEADLMMT